MCKFVGADGAAGGCVGGGLTTERMTKSASGRLTKSASGGLGKFVVWMELWGSGGGGLCGSEGRGCVG